MQTSGFAELSDFQAPALARAKRSPGLLAFGSGLFARRIGRIEQGVLMMAAPVTYQALATRAGEPQQPTDDTGLHWGLGG